MALIKFGAGISEMRGKEGGVIYSRNAYGSYIKTKISPVNPNTTYQQNVRSSMGNLAQAWSTLAAGLRAGWDQLGAQVTRVNRFGDTTTYTGFSLFMKLNRNLAVCGEPMLTTAPVPPTMPELDLTAFVATKTGSVLTLTFTPTPAGAAKYLVLYMTGNIVTGRQFVKNYYRFIVATLNAASAPLNIYGDWNSKHPEGLTAGANIFLKGKIIDQATGFESVPQVISAIVGA